jgi:hypothetical protein
MSDVSVRDYADSGLTIQYAMNDHATRFPNRRTRPRFLLWSGLTIWTSDSIPVPRQGIVRAEFLSGDSSVRQGFDLRIHDGWIDVGNGEPSPLLRTWWDERFEDVVEYPFCSRDGQLWVWNVYEMTYPSGEKVEEKWTENAGFWMETIHENERIYHCSHGMTKPPNFDSLVFKVSIRGR